MFIMYGIITEMQVIFPQQVIGLLGAQASTKSGDCVLQ